MTMTRSSSGFSSGSSMSFISTQVFRRAVRWSEFVSGHGC